MVKVQTSLIDLAEKLPPIISRSHVERFLGGIISSKSLANLDSLGEGPPRVKVSGRVAYRTEELLSWLSARSFAIEKGEGHVSR
ncbi:hypothetical protein [Desulfovibrio gilichinskyi]|uniref:Transcriptional regulator, AlpA family n=1 Tax=Desulfovibrio gilichinskyi TaxID=1519643 RepID=A0A1X7E7C5_9BACT|nr:hypothetical protein [Desulfovibrio gilichinskyi]SMF28528.1 hypothetical protein SAMN06295933_2718 [Desulfovibrio gilichinskyi]